MIDVQCSGCGKRYRVPEAFGGKKTRCKQCSAVISIPEPVPPPPVEDPIAFVESAPEPPPPVETERALPEAPAKPARKPMKLPARGAAAGGAKKPLSRPAFQARKPPGKPAAAAKPGAARRTRVVAPEGEEAHEVVGEKGGQRTKALLVGGILVIVLLGCAAGWYFLAGPGAAPPTPAAKAPKPRADATKDAAAPAAETKPAGADEGAAKVARLPGAPLDPLSSIPKDVHFVGQFAVGQIANIPGAREGIQKQIESSGLKEFFTDADLDPTGQIARAWIAGEIPASAFEEAPAKSGAGEDDTGVLVIEGTFDRSKLLGALEKHSLARKEEKKAGDLDVYQLLTKDAKAPRLVLPSDDQIILGTGAPFDGTLELLAGKGSSVRENAALATRAKDFESTSMVWLALQLPETVRAKMGATVEGAFLSIDRSPEGAIALAAHADCASPEDAAKTKQDILKPLLLLQPILPPPVAEALKGARVEAEGKAVSVSLEIPAEVLEKLESGMAEAAPGEGEEAPSEDAEAGDDAEPGEKGDAEMKEAEEAKESEAAEPEAETEAEPEPDAGSKAKAEEEEPAEEGEAGTEEKSGEE